MSTNFKTWSGIALSRHVEGPCDCGWEEAFTRTCTHSFPVTALLLTVHGQVAAYQEWSARLALLPSEDEADHAHGPTCSHAHALGGLDQGQEHTRAEVEAFKDQARVK
jgi:hypothetical protein